MKYRKFMIMILVLYVFSPKQLFSLESVELGFYESYRSIANPFFRGDYNSMEVSYYGNLRFTDHFSVEIVYYSYGYDLGYFFNRMLKNPLHFSGIFSNL